MARNTVRSMAEVRAFTPEEGRPTFSATPDEIAAGWTTDVYFVKTREILEKAGLAQTQVTAEIFARRSGVLCGVEECRRLLAGRPVRVEALPEGEEFSPKEVLMRIEGPYGEFGIFETALLGILASSSAWATAARECKQAAGDHPMVCFGARHVHPAVAPVMERAAMIGGADGAACILAAKWMGREPSGTMPHALFLVMGDTVEGAKAYDRFMVPGDPRIVLIDTYKDEAEEAIRVAEALGPALAGIRLDTPAERGGVTPELVQEVRWRLDQAGFGKVGIFVSGGLNPQRITELIDAGAYAFGVGSYISGAAPIDMTMDIKEVEGKPRAKRGRLPGRLPNPRLRPLLP